MTRIAFVATVVVLLLAFSGNLMAVSQPDCPATGVNVNTWSGTVDGRSATITATTPKDGPICNGSCCQTVTVSGLPLNWTLTGQIQSKFIFTTQCVNGQPKDPQIIDTFTVNFTSDGTHPFTQKVCYPATSSWASFEIHIDISLLVKDDLGNTATFVGNDPGVPGIIGPGGGSTWDPTCYNTNCTPGYWKNHCNSGCNTTFTWPGSYLPTDSFDTVFGVSDTCIPSTETLIAALGPDTSLNSGTGQKQMAYQCTAALLASAYANSVISAGCPGGNCIAFGQAEPVANIINKVQAACSGSVSLKDAAAYCTFFSSDSLCPFDGPWLGTCNGKSECDPITPGASCNPNVP